MRYESGQTFSFTRTFSRDDVAAFAAVSQDFGAHHVEPDAQGRVMVHGLHTASLATQIGGSINFISRNMVFEFFVPVSSGDTVTCVATIDEAEHHATKGRYAISFAFTNQDDVVVATGSSRGIILS